MGGQRPAGVHRPAAHPRQRSPACGPRRIRRALQPASTAPLPEPTFASSPASADRTRSDRTGPETRPAQRPHPRIHAGRIA
jgi:hypothetical protein